MNFITYLCCLVVPTKPLVSDSLFARFYRDFRYYSYSTLARIMSGDYEAVDECDGNFDPDRETSDDFNLNPWWVKSGYYLSDPLVNHFSVVGISLPFPLRELSW